MMFQAISGFFKIVLFLLNLYIEKDKEKSDKKEDIGKQIVEAFKETDKKERASKINAVIGRINRFK